MLDLGAGGAVALGDGPLEQVIMNLAANARDAMPDGGRLTIATSHGRGEDGAPCAVLTVADTGSGMDEETRAHAFEPFFTSKPIGQGTGLGLATVHGIVRACGGWIDLDSRPGAGTTIAIGLPRAAAPAEPPPPAPPACATTVTAAVVLVVEDDDQVRRATVRTLEALGLEVIAAASAEEVDRALAADGRAIDLLITDLVLPGQNGLVLARRLRERRADLPVLLVSGYSETDVSSVTGRPGGRFLAKPYTPPALAGAIDELLAPSGRTRRARAG